MFKDKKVIQMTDEIELETYLLGEVSDKRSNDYLQTYYFTHKCVDGNGDLWYKAHPNYTVEHTTALWFRDAEVSWFEEE